MLDLVMCDLQEPGHMVAYMNWVITNWMIKLIWFFENHDSCYRAGFETASAKFAHSD